MVFLSEGSITPVEGGKNKEHFLAQIAAIAKKSYTLSMEFLKLQSPNSKTAITEAWHLQQEGAKTGTTLTNEESAQQANIKRQQGQENSEARIEEIREETKYLTAVSKKITAQSSQLGVTAREIGAANEKIRQELAGEMLQKYREAVITRIKLSLEAALAPTIEETREIIYKQSNFNDEEKSIPEIGLRVFGIEQQQFEAIRQEILQQTRGELLNSYKNLCLEEANLFKLYKEVAPALRESTNAQIRETQRKRLKTGEFLISELQVQDSAVRLIRDQILKKDEPNQNKANVEQKENNFFRKMFDTIRSVFAPKLVPSKN